MKWWTLQLMATYCSDRVQLCPFLLIFCEIRIVSVTHWWTYATNKFYIFIYLTIYIWEQLSCAVTSAICHYLLSTNKSMSFHIYLDLLLLLILPVRALSFYFTSILINISSNRCIPKEFWLEYYVDQDLINDSLHKKEKFRTN